jgi:urease accessory protein
VGGFAHSDGLEALAAEGLVAGSAGIESLLAAHCRLTVRRADAWFVREAHRAAGAGDATALRACAREDVAARTALVQRRAALALGRNLLRVARAIAGPGEAAALEDIAGALGDDTPRATVFGALAHAFDVDGDSAVEGHVYSALSAAVAAAVRLTLIPPLEGQAVLRRVLVAARDEPGGDWSAFSPLLDVAAMRHEVADGRLFAS